MKKAKQFMISDGDMVLTLEVVLRIAQGVASAAAHLHACGLMHGDMYGHNILVDARGACLLGDFGAAAFLPMGDPATVLALQRLEVRAFGILLSELLAHCETIDPQAHLRVSAFAELGVLQQQCTQKAVSHRPIFEDIERQLTALMKDINLTAMG